MTRECKCLKTHQVTKYGFTAKFKKGETYLYNDDSGGSITVFSNETAEYNMNAFDENGMNKFDRYFESDSLLRRKERSRSITVKYFISDLPNDEIMNKIISDFIELHFPNYSEYFGGLYSLERKLKENKDHIVLMYNKKMKKMKLKKLEDARNSNKYGEDN